jgi:hypothetical protein
LERYYDSGYAFGSAGLGTLVLIKDVYYRIKAIVEGTDTA